jgi:hypothetical protein
MPPMGVPNPTPQIEPEQADPDEKPPGPDRNYLTDPVNEDLKRSQSDIRRILIAGKFAPGEQDAFDRFFKEYYFARWSQWKNCPNLPTWRVELRNFFRQAKSGEVYDHLNTLVLEYLGKRATEDYPPCLRINAALTIGELNVSDPSPTQPSAPLPAALRTLLGMVENEELPDAVRVAAMIGVMRHATMRISDEDSRRASTLMLRLLTEGHSSGAAAGREWLLMQAMETLGTFGSVGTDAAVYKALLAATADAKLSHRARASAAAALGQLNYAGVEGLDPAAAAAALGRFVLEGCSAQLKKAKDAGAPVPRQRIVQYVAAAQTALAGSGENRKGIASLAKEQDQQALLAELQKLFKDLIDSLDNTRSSDADAAKPVEEFCKKLEAWLQKAPR